MEKKNKKNTYHTVEDEARRLIYLCMALSKATTQSVQLPDLRCQYVAMAIGTACSGLPHGEESASWYYLLPICRTETPRRPPGGCWQRMGPKGRLHSSLEIKLGLRFCRHVPLPWLLGKLMFGDYCVFPSFLQLVVVAVSIMWANKRAEFQFDWMAQFSLLWPIVARTWKNRKNTVGHTTLLMFLSMTGPRFCQIYSKTMIVYCAHVNLHTEPTTPPWKVIWPKQHKIMDDPLENTWWTEIPIGITVG